MHESNKSINRNQWQRQQNNKKSIQLSQFLSTLPLLCNMNKLFSGQFYKMYSDVHQCTVCDFPLVLLSRLHNDAKATCHLMKTARNLLTARQKGSLTQNSVFQLYFCAASITYQEMRKSAEQTFVIPCKSAIQVPPKQQLVFCK